MNYTELRDEMKQAMRDKDKVRLSIIRQVLADVDLAVKEGAEETDELVNKCAKKVLRQTTETYEASIKAANDEERTAMLKEQCAILDSFLPEQVSGDALKDAVSAAIAEAGATSMKDMGKILSALDAKLGGNFDRGEASKLAKDLF